MQSSTVVACRATVMIVCLVAVPWLAIFGTSMPPFLKRLQGDSGTPALKTLSIPGANRDAEKAAAYGPLTDAPAYVPPGAASAPETSAAPGQPIPGQVAPPSFDPASPPSPFGGAAQGPEAGDSTRPSPNVPASFESPLGPRSDRLAAPERPAPAGSTPRGPEGLLAAPRQTAESPASRAANDVPSPDRFTSLEQRIRALGATYYLLETWGQEGQLYRFQCQMAIGRSAGVTKHFEAIDASAFAAMERVVREVESWRAKQGAPGRAG